MRAVIDGQLHLTASIVGESILKFDLRTHRHIIETVNSQLEKMAVERLHARTNPGSFSNGSTIPNLPPENLTPSQQLLGFKPSTAGSADRLQFVCGA
jgi:hypothetical protein